MELWEGKKGWEPIRSEYEGYGHDGRKGEKMEVEKMTDGSHNHSHAFHGKWQVNGARE